MVILMICNDCNICGTYVGEEGECGRTDAKGLLQSPQSPPNTCSKCRISLGLIIYSCHETLNKVLLVVDGYFDKFEE